MLVIAILGQIMPPLIDLVNKNIQSSKVRWLITIAICAGIGTAFNWQNLHFDNLDNILLSITTLWASAEAAYNLWYKGTSYQAQIRFNSSPFPVAALIPSLKNKDVITAEATPETPPPTP